jgi:hypothetical protein
MAMSKIDAVFRDKILHSVISLILWPQPAHTDPARNSRIPWRGFIRQPLCPCRLSLLYQVLHFALIFNLPDHLPAVVTEDGAQTLPAVLVADGSLQVFVEA